MFEQPAHSLGSDRWGAASAAPPPNSAIGEPRERISYPTRRREEPSAHHASFRCSTAPSAGSDYDNPRLAFKVSLRWTVRSCSVPATQGRGRSCESLRSSFLVL